MPAKAKAIGNLAALLNPGGVLFGATLLQEGVDRNPLARILMDRFNAMKTLHNEGDGLEGLRLALSAHLEDVCIEVIGCVAIFTGQRL
jgi:hypothetical protein